MYSIPSQSGCEGAELSFANTNTKYLEYSGKSEGRWVPTFQYEGYSLKLNIKIKATSRCIPHTAGGQRAKNAK